MEHDRIRRAMRLMGEALERRAETRGAFLDRACDDADVLAHARALIDAHERAAGFLVSPGARTSVTPDAPRPDDGFRARSGGRRRRTPFADCRIGTWSAAATDHLPESIAGYRVLGLLGAGGMGTVYLAEQPSPRRRVALKVLAGPWTSSTLARFALESEALARLRHPGIAMVHEAGLDGDGDGSGRLPYLAIELVEAAHPITDHADVARLDRRQRLELFRQVCEAVHHGHQKGVIHRDLKPTNILVDHAGHAKVIDFGIARLLGDAPGRARLTQTGLLLGTPAFMSPEQCAGAPDSVDVRCDVYALGAVLYELVCGRPAFDLADMPMYEAIATVRDREPRRPRSVVADLPRDLETIVLTALDKDPRRRYASVAALSADIGRHLGDRPIEARPTTVPHQVRLFARRHRPIVTAAALTFTALVGATAISMGYAIGASRAEAEALRQRDEAERRGYVATMAAAESALTSGEYARLRLNLAAAPAALRGWEWRHLESRAEPSDAVVTADPRRVFGVAASTDGRHLWSGGTDGALRRWGATTGELLEARTEHDTGIVAVATSPDGTLVASGDSDGWIVLVPTTDADGEPMASAERNRSPMTLRHGTGRCDVVDLAFSDDSRLLACGGADGHVTVWRVDDGARVADLAREGPVYAIVFDGARRLVVAGEKQPVDLVEIETGRVVRRLATPEARVSDMAWLRRGDSGDARVLLMALHDKTAVALDLGSREEDEGAPAPREALRMPHPRNVWSLAVSRDGTRFATGGGDMRVRVWRAADGALLRVFGGHCENVYAMAFACDDAALWSGGWDGALRRWEVASLDERPADVPVLAAHDDVIQALAFSPSGALLASAGRDGRVCLWDHAARRLVRSWKAGDGAVWSLAFSPDGATLATGLHDGTVVLWRVETGEPLATLVGHEGRVYSVAFSPDGRRLASGSRDRTARVWSRDSDDTWRETVRITHDQLVWVVAFSPDGELVATASWDRTVRLSSADNGSTLAVLVGHTDGIYGLAFSPDGKTLASGGRDRRVILWDVAHRRELRRLEDHGQFITGLAFLPDGSRLVGASWWGRVTLWDPRSGDRMVALRASDDASPRAIATSPDGRTIATAGLDRLVWLWEDGEATGDQKSEISDQTADITDL